MISVFLSTFFAITVMSGGVAGAATLNVVGGQLVGASGVSVGGALYDVEFVDGTCIDLFDGCDSPADSDFTTAGEITQALHALLSQVFIDGELGDFDSSPQLTAGCSILDVCEVLHPLPQAGGSLHSNRDLLGGYNTRFADDHFYNDKVLWVGHHWPSWETTEGQSGASTVWSRWTPIPEPSCSPCEPLR